jgi:hypothetical protein
MGNNSLPVIDNGEPVARALKALIIHVRVQFSLSIYVEA